MEVLNVVEPTVNGSAIFGMVWFGGLVLVTLFMVCFAIFEGEAGMAIGGAIVSVLCAASFLLFMNDYATPDPVMYEVLITDMSAFDTDKYEIIEQRGKVFVVKEVAE